LTFSKRLHQISNKYFFWKSAGGIRDLIDRKTGLSLSVLWDVLPVRIGRSVADTVRKYNPDPRVAQIYDHFTKYVGPSPLRPFWAGLPTGRRQKGFGTRGEPARAVPEALVRLGRELGVEYRTNVVVTRILVEEAGKRACGVETDGGERIELAAILECR
jgi:hypothetical protein